MEKLCTKCKKEPRQAGKRDGMCMLCRRAYQRDYHNRRNQAIAAGTWQYRETANEQHGLTGTVLYDKWQKLHRRGSSITAEDVQAAMDQFKGVCDICGTPLELSKAHFDHCHSSDKFRGWLCHGCNVGLGMFKDSPVLLAQAIKYLTERAPS